MKTHKKRAFTITLMLLSALFFGNSAAIWLKAGLAQVLISQAWSKTLQTGQPVKPWPWADTWPVARLRYQQHKLYVLRGANGSALAFGPGMAALPDSRARVIAGHRDTHFRFLRNIHAGDQLTLQDMSGKTTRYRITGKDIRDIRNGPLAITDDSARLALITCYPFDAIMPGGPMRLVVTATAERQTGFSDALSTKRLTF